MQIIAGHTHLVYHVLDQEQAPAARRLQPGQLGVDVRRLRLAHELAAALVGDSDRKGFGRAAHPKS